MNFDFELLNKVKSDKNNCEACIFGKQSKLASTNIKEKGHINKPLLNVHSDICGPVTPPSIDNKRYFMIFMDEYTHYCITYLASQKSDLFFVLKDFVKKAQANFNSKIVHLYIDNGREYLSNEMKDYCSENGISYHLTIPYTPHQNGVSERVIRTITEKARTLLIDAKLPQSFWGEAVLTATYLINRTPTRALKGNKTPFEMWHNKRPKLQYLRVFGSTAYVHDKLKTNKFEPKSWKGIFVGYVPNGYKIWNPETHNFENARDVIFDEVSYLATRPKEIENLLNDETGKKPDELTTGKKPELEMIPGERPDKLMTGERPDYSMVPGKKPDEPMTGKRPDHTKIPGKKPDESATGKRPEAIFNENSTVNKRQKLSSDLNEGAERRSDRVKNKPPVHYNENETIYDHILYKAEMLVDDIPTCFQEILLRSDKEKWLSAIKEEIDSLLLNKTWDIIQRPNNKNIVDCKWVFAIKTDEFGNPIRYKARLVAKGFSQKYLIDYNETFAPVARLSSFRFILAIANQFKLHIHHMDVKTAFLNGILKEEIYMKIPEGMKCKVNSVCKLNKTLYGLKQSARCWFETFDKALREMGFKNSEVDKCVYILDRNNINENVYLILYVDDLVIATKNIERMKSFKEFLMSKFKMTDLKEIKLFLGMRIERNNESIAMDQSSYVKSILSKFNMSECKPNKTPLTEKIDYERLNDDQKYDAPCQNLLGCLMYLMLCTRPDLSYAINLISRFVNKNNEMVWQYLKGIMRYLKGTCNLRLVYERNYGNNYELISGHVDSDWAGDKISRISTTGYVFKLFDKCIITWNTKKQRSVADSSTAAEYMALFEATKEAVWLKSLGESIKMIVSKGILLYEDNNGCIAIANNPSSHKLAKHIDIKYHYSRENVEKGNIRLKYVETEQQIADLFTKSLGPIKFLKLREKLGLKSIE